LAEDKIAPGVFILSHGAKLTLLE